MTAPAWADLVATALVGTDRRPIEAENPPAALLDACAVWAPYRRAGLIPFTQGSTTAAPAETAPVVAPAAGRRLIALLDGGGVPDAAARTAVLAQWLTLASTRGRRVPPHLLPELLDYARMRPEMRPLVAAVGGQRARWLAAQNPDWRYLTDPRTTTVDEPESTESWETGDRLERLAYLRRLRRADPAAARDRLTADWATLTPEERAEFLALFAERLSEADEALLERALDDRRREVREAAVVLLPRLTGSAHASRMAQRATGYLSIAADESLRVDPPVECDRSMRRDGIVAKPPSGTGERAWWLEQVLANTPLSTWTEPPEEFLTRPIPQEWTSTIHRGLARAAAIQRSPSWAAAVLPGLGDSPRDRALAAALYPVLDPRLLLNLALVALREGASARWGPLLSACPAPWPEELSRAAFAGIATLATRPNLAGDLHQLARLAAVRMAPELGPRARELAERISALDTFAAVLLFRHEMTQELL